jgi:hypothetical protein
MWILALFCFSSSELLDDQSKPYHDSWIKLPSLVLLVLVAANGVGLLNSSTIYGIWLHYGGQCFPSLANISACNWLGKYTNGEISTFQKEDPDLLILHKWLDHGLKPDRDAAASLSPAVRRYWPNYMLSYSSLVVWSQLWLYVWMVYCSYLFYLGSAHYLFLAWSLSIDIQYFCKIHS